MVQKIIQVGNSLAITIPKKIADSLGLDKKNYVDVYEEPEKKRIVIETSQRDMAGEIIDKEVYEAAKSLLKRYLPAFRELAKK